MAAAVVTGAGSLSHDMADVSGLIFAERVFHLFFHSIYHSNEGRWTDRFERMSDTARATVPAEQRCAWPGCTRRRAAERTTGSGRQKEYCLQADPPEAGGGPVHNARNRWASLRSAALRAAQHPADGAEEAGGAGSRGGGPAADRFGGRFRRPPGDGNGGCGVGRVRSG